MPVRHTGLHIKWKEKKKYSKVKIFLFLIFALFSLILITSIVRIMQDLFTGISEKNSELKCNDLRYSIDKQSIVYSKDNLAFELMNMDYDINISKITVLTGFGDYEYIPEKEVVAGKSAFVRLENVTLEKGFKVKINSCKTERNFALE